jgi:hypothetical protein
MGSSSFELPKKSKWRGGPVDSYCFFCPSCRADRKVPYRSRPGGARQVTQVLATALFFTLVTWTWFDWKGIVSFVPFWACFETYYRTRLRASLACTHCGFDPYLYLTDVKRAREEIERHWRAKFAERGIPYPDKNAPAPLLVPGSEAAKNGSTPLTAGDSER